MRTSIVRPNAAIGGAVAVPSKPSTQNHESSPTRPRAAGFTPMRHVGLEHVLDVLLGEVAREGVDVHDVVGRDPDRLHDRAVAEQQGEPGVRVRLRSRRDPVRRVLELRGVDERPRAPRLRAPTAPPRTDVTTSSPPVRMIVTRTASSTVSTSHPSTSSIRRPCCRRRRATRSRAAQHDQQARSRLMRRPSRFSVTFQAPSISCSVKCRRVDSFGSGSIGSFVVGIDQHLVVHDSDR